MTDHMQTSTMPRPPAFPRARKSGKRLPAARRRLRLAAPLPLLLAVSAGASVVPAQAASNTGSLFAGHDAPARGTAPASTCASRTGTGVEAGAHPQPGQLRRADRRGGALLVPGLGGGQLFRRDADRELGRHHVDTAAQTEPAWKRVPSLSPAGTNGSTLARVDAISPTSAWAAGSSPNGSVGKTLILHWSGTALKQVPSPSPGGTDGSALASVDATSPPSAWAVGSYSNTSMGTTLILHWNGTTWTKVGSNIGPSRGRCLENCAATPPSRP
jgi:hypothetical protein